MYNLFELRKDLNRLEEECITPPIEPIVLSNPTHENSTKSLFDKINTITPLSN